MAILRVLAAACVASAVAMLSTSVNGAQPDPRRFAGTQLNALYAEISFMPGLKKLLPEFEKETGIRVNLETMAEGAALQKAKLELATGTGTYDIIGAQSGDLPLYAQNKWLMPLDPFFGDSSLSDPKQLGLNDFIGSTRTAMAYEGKQYCLPFFAATQLLYYQIDKFKKAGITGAPKTIDELLKDAEALHTATLPAIGMRGSPASAAGNVWPFTQFFYGEGAKYFADFPKNLTPEVNSPQAVKALQAYITLKNKYGPKGGANFTFDDVVTAMQQGNIVMAIDGAPLAGRILDPAQSKVAGNLGFAVVPGGAAGPHPSFVAHGLCIATGARSPKAAYRFLEWATSAETMLKVAQNSTYLATPRNSVWENAAFSKKYNFDFGGGSFLAAYQKSLQLASPIYYPPLTVWPAISERMGQAIQQAEIGSKPPKQALDEANVDIKRILVDNGLLK